MKLKCKYYNVLRYWIFYLYELIIIIYMVNLHILKIKDAILTKYGKKINEKNNFFKF